MPQPPNLIDRDALTLRRRRAAKDFAGFLHHEAASQTAERLLEVNRTFTAPVIIGPQATLWRDVLTGAGVVDASDIVPDDDTLALAPGAHDLVLHALCLHASNDPVGQLIQCRRALCPDGLLIATLFGGQSAAELRAVFATAEAEIENGISPRVFPMGEIRDLGGLLQRAGFALPVADSMSLTITYDGLAELVRDLRAMAETNVLTTRRRTGLRRDVLMRAGEIYCRDFPAEDPGRIRATAEIIFLTGWAPGPDQPRALRPGSAATRLSDALGTSEVGLGRNPGADGTEN